MLLMDVRDVAKELKVSVRHVWKLHECGRLPEPIRLGCSVRWRRHGPEGLEAWITAGCPARDDWEAARSGEVDG